MAAPRSPFKEHEAPTIHSLPENALEAVLGGIPVMERHSSAVLVCRRWQQLTSTSPALLRRLVDIRVFGHFPSIYLPRMRSFAEWLATRAAPHVEQLDVNLSFGPDYSEETAEAEAAAADAAAAGQEAQAAQAAEMVQTIKNWSERKALAEATSLLSGMLAACGGPRGKLRHLTITFSLFPLILSNWLAPLSSCLQTLKIDSVMSGPTVIASMPHMPALRELKLNCEDVSPSIQLQRTARLPPSLAKLSITGMRNECELPPQLGRLTNLHTLKLFNCGFTSDSYAPLEHLSSSLQHLELINNYFPACLNRLTSLHTLVAGVFSQEEERMLWEALHCLTALTRLNIDGVSSPPAELACMPSLRTIYWGDNRYDETARSRLPGGGWLENLRALAAPADMLARSLPQLAQARQLEVLAAYDLLGEVDAGAVAPVVLWAAGAGHPSLRRLLLDCFRDLSWLPAELGAAVEEAKALNPTLHIAAQPQAIKGVYPVFFEPL